MKKKLLLLVFLIVSIVVTGLNLIPENPKQTSPVPTTTGGKRPNVFLIGAIQMEKDPNYFTKFDELKFNVWHNYVQIEKVETINGKTRKVPNGWYTFASNCENDELVNNNVSSYAGGVNAVINGNANHGYRSFIERPKYEYLIRGQKSIYQCEDV
ncbi:MAG: hypothetical protein PHN88_11385 [Ignavibacteria bacterium]|nr:hypothetical protein [Ignavibacteria bacterium]